jgi:hypothetical protein
MNTAGPWKYEANRCGLNSKTLPVERMLILTLARLNNERNEAIASNAWLCCMDSHDPVRIVFTPARQFWRAFAYVMRAHENQYIKRAGVAGIRARADTDYECINIRGAN